ncbi:ribosomal-processing cysteine protease Prp [Syntrophomonas wolfei]|jgi:hypothetical protein|uniref:ribosomal-processing cysteine protease Prp n=1 Tax=Syntrophomonas wolfei TaxID=863 RepID=UPI0007742A9B|nr:ribosomal-processing cysteine protease Prp [Syntrophomonas wolfei]
MLALTINYKNNKIISFKIEGHAGFAPEGEDIYCAGVSAVAQTALLGLIKQLTVEPKYKMEKGFLECELPPSLNEEELEKAQIILSTMEAGLLSMQEAYPGRIRVNIRRC